MTSKELFDLYKGCLIKNTGNDVDFAPGQYYRLCGYANGDDSWVVFERENKSIAAELTRTGHTLIDNLPPTWRGINSHERHWDWKSVIMPTTPSTGNLCCRCGNRYKNKREHNRTCR